MAYITLSDVDQIIHATDRAVLVRFMKGREVWIPRSQIEGGNRVEVGDEDIAITEWFADREGLE
jgi:hypothetical protein